MTFLSCGVGRVDTIFALDIGTRAVIGLMMQKSERGYVIKASARTEHSKRAMYDGQVHDVNEVARAVLKIKKELEQKLGIELKKVAVAAAGRAISTEIAQVSREEAFPIHWERQDVLVLEMEAVQQAMAKISTSGVDRSYFYCVGYSTVKQLLEDQSITSLVGQRGKKAELTVIATFLPRSVVDSLVAVLERAGLEMTSLTLEPIAAGQAAIPTDMRRLNLALVDIGAGTADIAITKDGSFFSYGMVPIAGDEVTEPISAHFLLDFKEAERIKRDLQNKEEVEILDFFGEKITVSKNDILDIITPTIHSMAERISQEILLLNRNKPQAIILVGGGSQTPLLGDFLSQIIELPRNRIGIQIRERLNNVSGEEEHLTGSDVVTPIGIGMAALDGNVLHYYSVSVNDINIPMFELQLATVAEALFSAGIHPRTFLGRPGSALIYELNGDIKVIKGGLGKPAQITVNGKPAKLEQRLNPGDCVNFSPGYSGLDAKAQLKDIISFSPRKKIVWNGCEEDFGPVVYLNDRPAGDEDWLEDGSKVTFKDNKTLLELLRIKGINLAKIKKKLIMIEGKPRELASDINVRVNGQNLQENYILQNYDRIEVIEEVITIRDLGLQAEPMMFIVNGEKFLFSPNAEKVFCKGKVLSPDTPVEDGMELKIEGFFQKPILSELLPYMNLTEKAIPGGKLEMLVNGHKAEFTTELNQGDRIIITWVN
jgi:cell division protein FtsA